MENKECHNCRKKKPVLAFHLASKNPDGYQYDCKSCVKRYSRNRYLANREFLLKQRREWKRKNPDTVKDQSRIKKYGVKPGDFQRWETEQRGRCAICKIRQAGLCIDHSHQNGKVRGLLCRPCNLGLGGFKDSIFNLRRAILYLAKQDNRKQQKESK